MEVRRFTKPLIETEARLKRPLIFFLPFPLTLLGPNSNGSVLGSTSGSWWWADDGSAAVRLRCSDKSATRASRSSTVMIVDLGRHGRDMLRCLAAVVLLRRGRDARGDEAEAAAEDSPCLRGKGSVSMEESLSASG